MTFDAAQSKLTEALAGPMSIALVGDVAPASAARLASIYVGSLVDRPAAEPGVISGFASAAVAPTSVESTSAQELANDAASVTRGFGLPRSVSREQRAIAAVRLALDVVQHRLLQELRDERGLVSSIDAELVQDDGPLTWPRATLRVMSRPSLARGIGRVTEREFARLIASGLDDDELSAARRRVGAALEAMIASDRRQADADALARLLPHRSRAALDAELAAVRSLNADAILEIMKQIVSPERRVAVTIAPSAGEPADGETTTATIRIERRVRTTPVRADPEQPLPKPNGGATPEPR